MVYRCMMLFYANFMTVSSFLSFQSGIAYKKTAK